MRTILAVDDENSILESYRAILDGKFNVFTAGSGPEALETLRTNHADLILLDMRMPEMNGQQFLEQLNRRGDATPVVIVSAMNSLEPAVEAMRHGARDYLVKPFNISQLMAVIERVIEERRMAIELAALREADHHGFDELIGESTAYREAVDMARQAAPTEATVLITGESGTGKDMLARAIHSAGPRSQGPFVHVSCCALPEHLIENELFGHERGAFTGATERRIGKVQVADGGTLFLDEIGEMPLAAQSKLLQLLQDSQFFPVGSDRARNADVRFICATNRHLPDAIGHGVFRKDLYYRINVVNVEMPPLRRRREDIGPLARHFIKKHHAQAATQVRELSTDAANKLAAYSWPGNVRELENIVQRALVIYRNQERLEGEDVARLLMGSPGPDEAGGIQDFEGLALQDAVARLERHLIERALERSDHVQSRAAELLGTTRRILKYKMDQLGVPPEGLERATRS